MIRGFFNVYMPLLVCVSIRLVIEEYRANWIYPSDGSWKKCVRPKFFSRYQNPTWPKTQWEKFSNHGDTDNPVHPFYVENFHLFAGLHFLRGKVPLTFTYKSYNMYPNPHFLRGGIFIYLHIVVLFHCHGLALLPKKYHLLSQTFNIEGEVSEQNIFYC